MKYNLKTLAAVTAIAVVPFAGIASASSRHNPCGIDKPRHEHHKKHDHDRDKSKVKCDCTSIWNTINEVIKRIEVLEAKPAVSGSPGMIGPEGPAGPVGPKGATGAKGPAGKTVVLTPVLVFPTQALKQGCAYVQVGGTRVGSTYRIRIGVVCASSVRIPVAG